MIFDRSDNRFKHAHYWLPGAILILVSTWVFSRLWEDNTLKLTYAQSMGEGVQVFWENGQGFSEENSFSYKGSLFRTRNSLSVPIDFDHVRFLRIDPVGNSRKVIFYSIGAKRRGNFFPDSLIRESYPFTNGIQSLTVSPKGNLIVEPVRDYADPYFLMMKFPPRPAVSTLWIKLGLFLLPLWIGLVLSMRYACGFWRSVAYFLADSWRRLLSGFREKVDLDESDRKNSFPWWFHAIMLLLVLGVLVFSRAITMPFPGYHADDVHKWFHGKMLLGEVPFSEWSWDHHTARLSIMAIVWIVQAVFGTDPMNYYLVPFIANIALFLGMYWLGCKISHPIPALVASVMLILFSPSQFHELMPSPFLVAFMVYGTIYYYKAVESDANKRSRLLNTALAAVFIFLAYLSWVGALFFLPAFSWLFFHKTGYKNTALFLGILLGGYILETAFYAVFAGIPSGRLGIIMSNHFGHVNYRIEWMDFFRRYSYLPGITRTFVMSFIYSLPFVLLLRKWILGKLLAFVLFPISFLLLLTFGVKSLDPLSLFLGYNRPRYAYGSLPYVYLGLACLGWVPFSLLGRIFRFRILRSPVFHLVLALLFVGHFVNRFWLTRNPRHYYTAQLQELASVEKMSDIAIADDLMVVEMDHPHAKGVKFYNDMIYPRDKKTPSPTAHQVHFGSRSGVVMFPGRGPAITEIDEDTMDFYKHRNICLVFEEFPVSAHFETVEGLQERGIRRKAKLWIGRWGETFDWVIKLLPKPEKTRPVQQKSLETEGSAWTLNGGNFEKKSRDIDYWGSWSGDDRLTGKLTLDMVVDHSSYNLRIPVRTGPNTKGMSIRIEDAKTGNKIVVLKEFAIQIDHWGFLDIPSVALEGSDEIKVIFEDTSDKWGAWMAVAIPGWL